MTKLEKKYKRNYGHKGSDKSALNYTRNSMKEDFEGFL